MVASRHRRLYQRTPPPRVALKLRDAFFRVAAGVLLRPSPAKEQDRISLRAAREVSCDHAPDAGL